jgi:hypothetical protein
MFPKIIAFSPGNCLIPRGTNFRGVAGTTFEFEYLREIETNSEKKSGYELGVQR